MSCHNGKTARAIQGAVAGIDSTIPDGHEWWHKGMVGDGDSSPAPPKEAADALRAAMNAAKRRNPEWDARPGSARLEANNTFVGLIREAENGELVVTRNQVQKLASYAAGKKEFRRASRVAAVCVAALMAASAMFAAQPAAAQTQGPVVTQELSSEVKNRPHVRDRDGVCPPGYELGQASETYKGTFVKWNSKPFKKKKFAKQRVKAGSVDCVLPKGAKAGSVKSDSGSTPFGDFRYGPDGEITGLPKGFPERPTVEDVEALGLTRDSKVSSRLRIPQPVAPKAPAELPDSVDLVSVGETRTESFDRGNGRTMTTTRTQTTWVVRGGQGMLNVFGSDEFVPLNPNGEVYVTEWSGVAQRNGKDRYIMYSSTHADYGQFDLPEHVTSYWNTQEMGGQGGSPVSKGGNMSRLGMDDNRASQGPDGTIYNV